MQAVRAVCDRGATVKKIFTVVDRLEGAAENPGKEDIELVATIRFATCLAERGSPSPVARFRGDPRDRKPRHREVVTSSGNQCNFQVIQDLGQSPHIDQWRHAMCDQLWNSTVINR
jgi:hypothetical protein